MPFGQHQDRVLVLTKRYVGSGNEIGNSIAPCVDGVVVVMAVRTSQSATISSWSSYYILVGGNVKLNSNYSY